MFHIRLLAAYAVILTLALGAQALQNQKAGKDGQNNQKDDGQQNQNGNKKDPLKTAELKAQPGKFDFGWFMPKAKGNILQNNQLGKGKTGDNGNGQNNQNDDGQKNQKDDGQKNQNGDKKAKG